MSSISSSSIQTIALSVTELIVRDMRPILSRNSPEEVATMQCWKEDRLQAYTSIVPSLYEICKKVVVQHGTPAQLAEIEEYLGIELMGVVVDFLSLPPSTISSTSHNVPPPPPPPPLTTDSPPMKGLAIEVHTLVLLTESLVKKSDLVQDSLHQLAISADSDRKLLLAGQQTTQTIASALLEVVESMKAHKA